jgi:hypothetical protein
MKRTLLVALVAYLAIGLTAGYRLFFPVQQVPKNEYAFFDPRPRRASQNVVLTPEVLARFQPGPGRLRGIATGRAQWSRVPPPVVKELAVEIQPN